MARLIDRFSNSSGFKVLAMARLNQTEYGIVLYLLNCAASNLNEVITTEAELSSLVGYKEKDVHKAIENLMNRRILKVKYANSTTKQVRDAVCIGIEFDFSQWSLDFKDAVDSKDAVVFPFRRSGEAHLQVLYGEAGQKTKKDKNLPTWKRVLDSFSIESGSDDEEAVANAAAARILVETHPVDQVLLIIRHFGSRIPTLSLLAGSWQHFQELFEEETSKVDILEARQKHIELDEKLRQAAISFLEETDLNLLSEEERTVLEILSKHRHPRRQLFWAFQTRARYPKLAGFFSDHASLMLGVTSSGKVLGRNKE